MIKPISRCLNPQLQQVCRRTLKLDELNEKITQYLPSPLNQHCRVGSFNGGCLLITANNSAWASELRYCIPELRDQLRKSGVYQLTAIRIAVALHMENKVASKKKSKLSAAAAANFEKASLQCSYPPLKALFKRLAER